MKALQIQLPGKARMVEVEDPVAGPREVIVRVEAIASCPHWDVSLMQGWDLFHRRGLPRYPCLPGQPGHEMAGVVESVGARVKGFAPGDPVATWRTMGEDKLGYYAEKACVPATNLLPRPRGVSAADGASLEMAMCVAACFVALPSLRGQRFSVGGLGPAGLIAVQLAKAAGAARVIGFDLNPERRQTALTVGADEVVDPTAGDAKRFTAQAGAEVDYAIDCSGSARSVQFQMDITGKALALFGVPHEAYIYKPKHFALTIIGYPGHSLRAAQYAMQRLATGALRLGILNGIELPLSQFAKGTALLEKQKVLKVLYRP